ncbi:hypothetical protein EB235_16865 [Mesorhizobium loti R88b]|uniref:Uncharacterized protein n=2 Tax=Rhizobium loti TaxID=381 RepID=A0A6M7WQS8_RHILI|nr:hypothetical protein EB235_16865 [Mesorhizobium loti R88b]
MYRDEVVARQAAKTLDFAALYSAALNWSSIQTGFLFGIFGFVAGKNDGFIEAVKSTGEMRIFSRYMRLAMSLGFVVTIASIALMVINFAISDGSTVKYGIFCVWAFLTTWAFFSFARVAYVFGILVRTGENTTTSA